MCRAVVLVSVLALVLGACGGDASEGGAAGTGAASTTEPLVIRTRMLVAATERADIPAIGEVLEGSTLGNVPFCVGGTVEDRHASDDPAAEPYGLLDRTITCPDGTVRVGFTPKVTPEHTPGLIQAGSWIIFSGTGAFERLRGNGEMETTYDPVDGSVAQETLIGTVTH